MSGTFDILASTNFGLEAVAARELKLLGFEAKGHGTGRVLFQGNHAAVARANLWLRTAGRVLLRVMHFPCRDFDTLYETVQEFPWEEWIPRDSAFPVNGRSVKSQLSSVPACQRTVKKAIVQRLMRGHKVETLPEAGPSVTVEIELLHDVATVTLDTSGDGLHKRGYRPMTGDAALKETMAAGLVQLSVWRPHRALVDPFCGTGTIAIEAAMLARNIAPGLKRSFDAEQWPGPWKKAFDEAREEARAAPRGELAHTIHASDIDERSLKQARYAATLAGVERDIHFKAMPFEELSSKVEHGCVIANPPWGLRLETDERELEALYREMPLVFRRLPTWSFHILTGKLDLERDFGQAASRRRKFYTGGVEAWYFTFLGPKAKREEKGDRGEGGGTRSGEGGGEERGPALDVTADQATIDGAGDMGEPRPEAASVEAWRVRSDGRGESAESPVNRSTGEEKNSSPSSSLKEGELARASFSDTAAAEPHAPNDSATTASTSSSSSSSSSSSPAPSASSPRPSAASPALRPPRSPQPSVSAFGGLRDRDLRELEDFRSRLAKNAQHLRKYPSRGVTCYRVYERDCPDVPLIVDIYEERAHVVEYEREHSRTPAQQADWWDRVRAIAGEVLSIAPAFVYTKEKHRQRGLTQHEKKEESGEAFLVQEGGLRFEVNLRDYVDTGLFLDHRLTRKMVMDQAKDKRFLNLFCYTGSFTVYAAAGGAKSTVSVDLSNTYLDWAERNLRHNSLEGQQHTFLRDDVLTFLERHPRPHAGHGYDLAVVDPPTFSNSKSTEMDWEVAQTHPVLLRLLVPLMNPGGVIYFSTNYRRFKLDEGVCAELGLQVREISRQTVPPEYRNERIHRCWRMVVGG